jgi:hypothetical protein
MLAAEFEDFIDQFYGRYGDPRTEEGRAFSAVSLAALQSGPDQETMLTHDDIVAPLVTDEGSLAFAALLYESTRGVAADRSDVVSDDAQTDAMQVHICKRVSQQQIDRLSAQPSTQQLGIVKPDCQSRSPITLVESIKTDFTNPLTRVLDRPGERMLCEFTDPVLARPFADGTICGSAPNMRMISGDCPNARRSRASVATNSRRITWSPVKVGLTTILTV